MAWDVVFQIMELEGGAVLSQPFLDSAVTMTSDGNPGLRRCFIDLPNTWNSKANKPGLCGVCVFDVEKRKLLSLSSTLARKFANSTQHFCTCWTDATSTPYTATICAWLFSCSVFCVHINVKKIPALRMSICYAISPFSYWHYTGPGFLAMKKTSPSSSETTYKLMPEQQFVFVVWQEKIGKFLSDTTS